MYKGILNFYKFSEKAVGEPMKKHDFSCLKKSSSCNSASIMINNPRSYHPKKDSSLGPDHIRAYAFDL